MSNRKVLIEASHPLSCCCAIVCTEKVKRASKRKIPRFGFIMIFAIRRKYETESAKMNFDSLFFDDIVALCCVVVYLHRKSTVQVIAVLSTAAIYF